MEPRSLSLLALSGLVISLDQFLKYALQWYFRLNQPLTLFPGLTLNPEKNLGLLSSAFSSNSILFHQYFFIGIPVFALGLIIWIFIKIRDGQYANSVGLTLILSGALGNLMDRIAHHRVIDLLMVGNYPQGFYLALNLADISIVVGVGILFWSTIRSIFNESLAQQR